MVVQNPKMIDPYVLLDVADLKLHNLPNEILDIDDLDAVQCDFSNKAWSALVKLGPLFTEGCSAFFMEKRKIILQIMLLHLNLCPAHYIAPPPPTPH